MRRLMRGAVLQAEFLCNVPETSTGHHHNAHSDIQPSQEMNLQHQGFLSNIQAYIEQNPDAAAYVSDYVARGIDASRRAALERAADMEVALSVAIAKRWKGRESLILSKLKKWNGKSSLRWDDEIKALEEA